MFEIGHDIQVQATVGTEKNDWLGSTHLPTFVLPSLLGIASLDHAGAIALEILFPVSIPREVTGVSLVIMVLNGEAPIATCTYVRKHGRFIQV